MRKIWLAKLKKVMEERGLKPKPLSVAAKLNATYIRDLEDGSEPSITNLGKLADALGLPLSYFFDDSELPPAPQVPLIGYAAGGEEWTPFDNEGPGGGFDHIALDLSDADPIGIRVRGHSMAPVYRDGDDLICSRLQGTDLRNAVNRDCVLRTTKGQSFIKHLLKGTQRNAFRLRSYNPAFADIENVALEWAAPVVWIRRK